MTTTAHYRNAARGFEAALNWSQAASAWEQAILLYPRARDRNGNPRAKQSTLAIADIVKMSARLDACMFLAQRG